MANRWRRAIPREVARIDRRTQVLSLRLIAAFGAAATLLTFIELTTGVSIPRTPLAVLAGSVAVGQRTAPQQARRFAAVALGLVAAVVFATKSWPRGPATWEHTSVLATELLAGAAVAVCAAIGMALRSERLGWRQLRIVVGAWLRRSRP